MTSRRYACNFKLSWRVASTTPLENDWWLGSIVILYIIDTDVFPSSERRHTPAQWLQPTTAIEFGYHHEMRLTAQHTRAVHWDAQLSRRNKYLATNEE